MGSPHQARFVARWLVLAATVPGCFSPAQGTGSGGGPADVDAGNVAEVVDSEVLGTTDAGGDTAVVLADSADADSLAVDAVTDAAADADSTALDGAQDLDTTPETDAGGDVSSDAGGPVCDDAAKRCAHAFAFVGEGSETTVELRGSFNGWKAGVALVLSAGTWSASAPMPWNTPVQYKFRIVMGGVEKWINDPGNPDTADDGFGGKNSLLQPGTCDDYTCQGPQTICGIDAKPAAFDWRDAVLYFVFVDRFNNGNPANDKKNSSPNVADIANWQGGDWVGVQQKIEAGYFEALGVNALWLSVPMDNADTAEVGDDGKLYAAYHAYWPRDPSKTEAHFGDMAALQALVKAAHQHGLQVLLDYAMNHVHTSSPVFQAHAADGWFNPEKVNGQDCVCGSQVCPWDGPSMVYCWFQTYLADFDFNNAAARKASIDNVIWWMQQSGADGLRLDAIKHVAGSWLTDLRARLLTEVEPIRGQHIYLVGETYTGDQGLIKSFLDPCAKLDGQFDFPLRAKLDEVALLRKGTMNDLSAFMDSNDSYYGAGALMSTFIGNHDLPRVIHYAQDTPLFTDVWDNGKSKSWSGQPAVVAEQSAYERVAVAMGILLTNQGVPLIYYGDEIAMPGAGDPDNRRMMQWTGQSAPQTWLLQRMQKLGQIRSKHSALRRGTRSTVAVTAETWTYAMTSPEETVYVAVNRGDTPADVGGLPAQSMTDLVTGDTLAGPQLALPARSVRVMVTK